jgi:hypothetical protein
MRNRVKYRHGQLLENMYDWKGMLEKAGEVYSRKASITNDESAR